MSRWLWLADPFPSELPNTNLFDKTALTREAKVLRVSEELGRKIPTSEILTIGCDENGNLLNWHMVGEPDEWPLIYASLDGLDCDLFNMSLTRFLYHWVANDFVPSVVDHYDLFSDRGRFYERVAMR